MMTEDPLIREMSAASSAALACSSCACIWPACSRNEVDTPTRSLTAAQHWPRTQLIPPRLALLQQCSAKFSSCNLAGIAVLGQGRQMEPRAPKLDQNWPQLGVVGRPLNRSAIHCMARSPSTNIGSAWLTTSLFRNGGSSLVQN